MTKDEFLPTLSQQAQDIVNYNLKSFKNNRSFTVFYSSDESKVVSRDGQDYIIYVKDDVPDDIEYRFLHEFFHCVQDEEGFPSIIACSDEYEEFATEFSSIILDLDVRERLENNGYFQDLKYIRELVKAYIKMLKLLRQYNDKSELNRPGEMIDLAGLIITSKLANIDNKKLVSLVKKVRPKAMWYYNIFSECIEKYSYNDANDVEKIFEFLIDRFKLHDYVEMKLRM